MSTDAISLSEAPNLARTAPETFLERQAQRLEFVGWLAGYIGVANTAQIIYDKLAAGERQHDICVKQQDLFRLPLTISTNISDVCTYVEIAKQQVYALPPELDKRVNGRQIIDIGANIGLSPTYLASRYPDSSVLAAEPHPGNFGYLETNSQGYDGQIQPVNVALASSIGSVGMSLAGDATPSNHAAYIYAGEAGIDDSSDSVSIAITPAEIAQHFGAEGIIGLLKIDIEGAETDIFASEAIDPLLELTETMMIETHDQYAPGSSQAVHHGAVRNGLQLYSDTGHTTIYSRV